MTEVNTEQDKKPVVDKTTGKQLGGVTGKGFMPGVSGNPNGRPAGSISITTAIKRKLEETPDGQKKTYLVQIVDKLIEKALIDGDEKVLKLLWNYIDGMPKASIDLTHGVQQDQLTELTEFFRSVANKNKKEDDEKSKKKDAETKE